MADKKAMRTYLNFNSYDFRHRKVIEILSARPRSKTELVVNAVLHYINCPEAGEEFSEVSMKRQIREVIHEMLADGSLSGPAAPPPAQDQEPAASDDFSDMMAAFRGGN